MDTCEDLPGHQQTVRHLTSSQLLSLCLSLFLSLFRDKTSSEVPKNLTDDQLECSNVRKGSLSCAACFQLVFSEVPYAELSPCHLDHSSSHLLSCGGSVTTVPIPLSVPLQASGLSKSVPCGRSIVAGSSLITLTLRGSLCERCVSRAVQRSPP